MDYCVYKTEEIICVLQDTQHMCLKSISITLL